MNCVDKTCVNFKFSRFSTSQDNPRQRIVFAKIRKNRNAVNLFAPKAAVVSINAYFPENQACAAWFSGGFCYFCNCFGRFR